MPTSPPPTVPALSTRGTIARIYTYTTGRNGAFSYRRYQPTKAPTTPVWNMLQPSNQIAAAFLDLSPAELATWSRPSSRARLPARTFFLRYNLRRFNHYNGTAANITRTYP